MARIITRGGKRTGTPAKKKTAKPAKKKTAAPGKTTTTSTTTASTTAPHSTLDLAAMAGNAGAGAPDETQAITEGGPDQEGAVFSTGGAYAPQLSYRQTTTYQEVYAQQMAQGADTTGSGG